MPELDMEFCTSQVSADFPSIPASVVYNCLHDSKYRKTWDRNMVESREICVLDANNDIGYYQSKLCFHQPMDVTLVLILLFIMGS